jgi:acetyl esterase/lipase
MISGLWKIYYENLSTFHLNYLNMLKTILVSLTIISFMHQLDAQDLPLYSDKIPNSKVTSNDEESEKYGDDISISKISIPTIRHYPAPGKTTPHTAVIIFPGGGYANNSITHEGYKIANKFNDIGITAFVVKYRIPNDATMGDKTIGPLQDAQQAIKLVRERAKTYKINPARIGVMGFSAGGHLASTAGTHFKKAEIKNENKTSLRPDFMMLIYPVISFQDDIGHMGSRDQLIGKNPSADKVQLYSNELQVTNDTPPTFLVHGGDDSVVLVENSIRFYEGLLKQKVPAELHVYPRGEHGFGLNNKATKDDWFERCKNWIDSNGWLTP